MWSILIDHTISKWKIDILFERASYAHLMQSAFYDILDAVVRITSGYHRMKTHAVYYPPR